jgi:hypothetical protein
VEQATDDAEEPPPASKRRDAVPTRYLLASAAFVQRNAHEMGNTPTD